MDESVSSQLMDTEAELASLEVGNHDVRLELLRKHHLLSGGNPNITDQELDNNYYKKVWDAILKVTKKP